MPGVKLDSGPEHRLSTHDHASTLHVAELSEPALEQKGPQHALEREGTAPRPGADRFAPFTVQSCGAVPPSGKSRESGDLQARRSRPCDLCDHLSY